MCVVGVCMSIQQAHTLCWELYSTHVRHDHVFIVIHSCVLVTNLHTFVMNLVMSVMKTIPTVMNLHTCVMRYVLPVMKVIPIIIQCCSDVM